LEDVEWSKLTARFAIAASLTLSALWVLGCSDDKEGDGEEPAVRVVDVCASGGPLAGECGDSCETTPDCPDGQFCDDGSCYAECTPERGCVGTCTADGECEGERETVVIAPEMNQGEFIEDPDSPPLEGDFASCATGQAAGSLTPVAMYVMFDNSLSMEQNNKWPQATEAMTAFFQDPESAGLKIALRFFGNNPTPGCDGEACSNDTVSACGDPQVDLGSPTAASAPEDAHEAELVEAVERANPDFGGTPMYAALAGSLQWATAHKGANPNEETVVLFLTDGVPQYQDCTEDIQEIAALASDGLDQGVRTYAIGLEGSQEDQMDSIAEAGGTGQGIFIGAGDASAQLLEALRAIRGQVASCDVRVPEANNDNVDPQKVNVTVTLDGQGVTLGQVADEGACGDDGAWYYAPGDTSRILLCPASCEAVQDDPESRIDIVFGCETSNVPVPITR
jgi:hypothetical protein